MPFLTIALPPWKLIPWKLMVGIHTPRHKNTRHMWKNISYCGSLSIPSNYHSILGIGCEPKSLTTNTLFRTARDCEKQVPTRRFPGQVYQHKVKNKTTKKVTFGYSRWPFYTSLQCQLHYEKMFVIWTFSSVQHIVEHIVPPRLSAVPSLLETRKIMHYTLGMARLPGCQSPPVFLHVY